MARIKSRPRKSFVASRRAIGRLPLPRDLRRVVASYVGRGPGPTRKGSTFRYINPMKGFDWGPMKKQVRREMRQKMFRAARTSPSNYGRSSSFGRLMYRSYMRGGYYATPMWRN